MATEKYNYTEYTEFTAFSPPIAAYDITPSANDLAFTTIMIMVSEAATITGILAGDTTSHTTQQLTPGIMYPFSFKKITAVSAGSVKGYGILS